jgi:hypothetical protein
VFYVVNVDVKGSSNTPLLTNFTAEKAFLIVTELEVKEI